MVQSVMKAFSHREKNANLYLYEGFAFPACLESSTARTSCLILASGRSVVQHGEKARKSESFDAARSGMYSTALSGVQGLLQPDTDWVYTKKHLGTE